MPDTEIISKPNCWGEVGCIREDFVLPWLVNLSDFSSTAAFAGFGVLETSHIICFREVTAMLMASHLGAALAPLRGLGQEGAFKSDFLHGLENPT